MKIKSLSIVRIYFFTIDKVLARIATSILFTKNYGSEINFSILFLMCLS